jgi:hypothetical protein
MSCMRFSTWVCRICPLQQHDLQERVIRLIRLQSAHGLERLEHEVRGGGCELRRKRRSKAIS